jgi:tripartite-type tricarboxylate transporter receptor subunit TctC
MERKLMKLPRRKFLHLAAGAAAVPTVSRFAWAQAYPFRPVRIIVPLAPGGTLDFNSRMIGEFVSRSVGQQVIVENKPGAGGMIGIEAAAKSAPDGYTILITTDVITSGPHLTATSTDFVRSLEPVIQLTGGTPLVLAVHPSLGVSAIAELVALAKQRLGLGYATSGAGTQQHFIGEWFAKLANIKLEHVPYRGAGQAINDLIAGHVGVGILGPVAVIPHAKSGALRMLAQSTQKRSPSLPDVPTFEEAGIKGLVLPSWQGAFVPRGTPPAIITRLNAEMHKALLDQTVRERLLEAAQEPVGGTPAQLASLVREDFEKYGRLSRELKIRGE